MRKFEIGLSVFACVVCIYAFVGLYIAYPWWMLSFTAVGVLTLVYLAFCFTYVKEGTAKNVVRFGGYVKTLLAKKGYKLSPDGYVVPLQIGERPQHFAFLGGLRWVSLLKPLGIDRIYTRTMKYVKALPDGNFEHRADENTDFVLAGTQFQYGLEFSSTEDSDKLPLSGKMTMTAMIVNPYKALFLVKNWFDALVMRVLPRVREYISEHTYDDIIKDQKTKLDTEVFKALGQPDSTAGPSIISILKEQYGIDLVALETVNIDPPEGYREATLAKWKARQTADKDMEETAGRVLKSVARLAHINEEELKELLEDMPALRGLPNAEGGFKEDFERAWDQLKRDRAGDGLEDIRVGNVDGTPLEPAIGAIAAMFGLGKRKSSRRGGKSSSNPSSGAEKQPSSQGPKDKDQKSREHLDKIAEEIQEKLKRKSK